MASALTSRGLVAGRVTAIASPTCTVAFLLVQTIPFSLTYSQSISFYTRLRERSGKWSVSQRSSRAGVAVSTVSCRVVSEMGRQRIQQKQTLTFLTDRLTNSSFHLPHSRLVFLAILLFANGLLTEFLMSSIAQSSLPSDPATAKADLRRRLLKARQAIPPQQWRQKSDRICAHLQTWPTFQNARCILAYWSFRNEPDLSPLMDHRRYRGLPRCSGKNLFWHQWQGAQFLQTGLYGITEPVAHARKFPPTGWI